MAQPCLVNCPRSAIRREDGHAVIDPERCVDCGRCRDLCPYGAIVKTAVPCEEACPVEAITLTGEGPRTIDPARCIACGRCMAACPFGAVAEVSESVEVLGALQRGDPLVALWAPALAVQFEATPAQVAAALERLGFHASLPVAAGADLAAAREAEELRERLEADEPCLTSSCCPAFTGLIRSRFPALAPRVSTTPTPLQVTARLARERHPGLPCVFLSPCVAKRREVQETGSVNHVLTFEELGAAFVAAGIDVGSCAPAPAPQEGSPLAYGFAAAGGVRNAVLAHLPADFPITTELLAGLGPEAQRTLRSYAAGRGGAQFLEGMACAGGCLAGPCTLADPRTAGRRLVKAEQERRH
jgi:iron only hydrogenase large subunit-like protein